MFIQSARLGEVGPDHYKITIDVCPYYDYREGKDFDTELVAAVRKAIEGLTKD